MSCLETQTKMSETGCDGEMIPASQCRQQSCFIRDPGQTALYPGGRLSASCWKNTYHWSLLGNCGSTSASLQLGLNHLHGRKDEFSDVNEP